MPEGYPGPMEIWHAINLLNKKLLTHADHAFSQINLRFIEFRILFTLSRIGPTPMVRIAEELGVTKPAVTSITDDMESKGLVRRSRDGNDRRIQNVEITSSGKKLLARAEETHFGVVSQLFSALTTEEKKTLLRSYEKIDKALDSLIQSQKENASASSRD